MKTITKRTKPNVKIKFAAPAKGCSFTALPVHGIESRRDDGGNSCEAEFQTVIEMLQRNYQHQSFGLVEALSLSRGLNLDPLQVQKYWETWIRKMVKSGALLIEDGNQNSVCGSPLFRHTLQIKSKTKSIPLRCRACFDCGEQVLDALSGECLAVGSFVTATIQTLSQSSKRIHMS
jgi:hypothetical protein